MKRIIVFRVIHGPWRVHIVRDVRVLIQEVLETQGRNVLNFLLKNLINRVATVLQHVNQIHNLLFSQFKVRNLICEELALPGKVGVGLHHGREFLHNGSGVQLKVGLAGHGRLELVGKFLIV